MRNKPLLFQNANAVLLIGILSLPLSGAVGSDSGLNIAARHSVVIESASQVVLGNGAIGFVVESADRSENFFEGTLVGEHWLIQDPVSEATPAPAVRVPLCGFKLRISSATSPRIAGSRLTSEADYGTWSGLLKPVERSDEILAATLTVSPTRDLVMGRVDFRTPCDSTLEIKIPSDFDNLSSSPAPRTLSPSPGVLTVIRSLPYGESYGLGLSVRSDGDIRATTTEWGGVVSSERTTRLEFALLVVHPEEGISLEKRTDSETASLSERDWSRLLQEDRDWRAGFWDRAIVDTTGSSDSRAREFENRWIVLRHGFATHARGTFPPADTGFWPSPVGGRAWHPLLWETFRGWILTGNEADIRWLSYPLSLIQGEEVISDLEAIPPLLPPESGPEGIASQDLSLLERRISGLASGATPTPDAIAGLQYTAIPLLVDCLAGFGTKREETDELFPYLKENAVRAEETLKNSVGDPLKIRPLLIAIEAARRQAERIHADPRSQERWKSILEPHGLAEPIALQHLQTEGSSFRSGPNDLDTLSQIDCTPDGLVRDGEGNPSLVLTGMFLSRLADCVFSERDGGLRILPDIPMDGSWSLEVKNISVPGGFTLRTLAMRKGVVDSFLLRSNAGGVCRLKLPSGWSSARVLNVGDPQSPVKAEGRETLSFQTKRGEEFLVAPVW